jgi:hypothetical protein
MRIATILASAATFVFALVSAADPPAFPTFRGEEIDKSLKIGYAVKIVDLNGDGKPDIIVVDKHRVIWFENPGKPDAPWKLHTILEGTTKPDNVCLDVFDIDGDGKLDIALGAGWKPPNTTDPGTIQWLKQPANIDEPWKVYPIGEEPSVHRMRFLELGGQTVLIVAPLQGAGTTAKNNWSEKGARLLMYRIPKDPTGPWSAEVIDDSLHAVHNLMPVNAPDDGKKAGLAFASYEGLTLFWRPADRWLKGDVSGLEGDQSNPSGSRGCSEVRGGFLKNHSLYFATIEPWHGNKVVVYTRSKPGEKWQRHVIDTELKWGHGLWCCDLDGDGVDEIVVGVRDPLNEKIRSGVNVFRATDADGTKWEKHVIDNGGVAVEDLACADLNGDGKIDIVAVGRATGNVKIYWNQGK